MILLLGIGFVAGVITAVSPCVLPVLPILLAGGASGRKPLRIIAGLVASFSVFTLFATWLLNQLGLPQDFLRNLAIAFLFVLAATLARAAVRDPGRAAAGRLLPLPAAECGRRLRLRRGARTRLRAVRRARPRDGHGRRGQRELRRTTRSCSTLAYAVGAAVPMLAIAYGGREAAARLRRTRADGPPRLRRC